MELLLLDKNFKICGIVDDYSSLVWNRKYYECGSFILEPNINNLKQFKNAKYLYCKEFTETSIIETFNKKDTIIGTQASYAGRFLESILEQRVINKTQKFVNKTTEDIIRSLVNTYAINSENRAIPNLVLGERKGIGTVKTLQITGDNLLTKIYELCIEDELSISLKYDFNNNQLVFDVWQGLDRRDTQNENTWAIFSKNFENILEDEYSIDDTKYCNFAYVAGQGEGENRVIVEVNRAKEGEERKELYVDARDLQKDEETTDAEYLEILKQRGIEKLNEYNKVETTNFNINTLSNLEYKKDFNLGDKVIYVNDELEFNIENRIIEITESYENGNKTINITFGDEYNIKKIKEVI